MTVNGNHDKGRSGDTPVLWLDQNAPSQFKNHFPEHELYPHLAKTVPLKKLKGITGIRNYVVLTNGELIVGKRGNFPGGWSY